MKRTLRLMGKGNLSMSLMNRSIERRLAPNRFKHITHELRTRQGPSVGKGVVF